jgi:hypothetical protein
MTEFLSDPAHTAGQIFGACVAAYWTIRLAIRHEREEAGR